MTFCRIEQELAIYQRKVDAEVAHEDAVAARVAELMALGAEFDPLKASNLGEAWGDYSKYDEHELMIAGLLIAGKDAEVGAYFRKISFDYWKPLAERQAEIDAQEHFDLMREQAERDEAESRYEQRREFAEFSAQF